MNLYVVIREPGAGFKSLEVFGDHQDELAYNAKGLAEFADFEAEVFLGESVADLMQTYPSWFQPA